MTATTNYCVHSVVQNESADIAASIDAMATGEDGAEGAGDTEGAGDAADVSPSVREDFSCTIVSNL